MKRLPIALLVFLVSLVGTSFAQSGDIVKIIPLKSADTVEVGTTLTYSASVHHSVGETVSVSVDNDSILAFVDSEMHYKHKQKRGMAGGDAATKVFTFEAVAVGEAELRIEEYFRGELVQENVVRIVVI